MRELHIVILSFQTNSFPIVMYIINPNLSTFDTNTTLHNIRKRYLYSEQPIEDTPLPTLLTCYPPLILFQLGRSR